MNRPHGVPTDADLDVFVVRGRWAARVVAVGLLLDAVETVAGVRGAGGVGAVAVLVGVAVVWSMLPAFARVTQMVGVGGALAHMLGWWRTPTPSSRSLRWHWLAAILSLAVMFVVDLL